MTLSKTELYVLSFEYIQSIEYMVCSLANILTIVAVIKFENLHNKSTNILILSLAIADSLLGKFFFHCI